jgi:hypothetical protein
MGAIELTLRLASAFRSNNRWFSTTLSIECSHLVLARATATGRWMDMRDSEFLGDRVRGLDFCA